MLGPRHGARHWQQAVEAPGSKPGFSARCTCLQRYTWRKLLLLIELLMPALLLPPRPHMGDSRAAPSLQGACMGGLPSAAPRREGRGQLEAESEGMRALARARRNTIERNSRHTWLRRALGEKLGFLYFCYMVQCYNSPAPVESIISVLPIPMAKKGP